MDHLQETSIYLAALLDGEGYVQLTEHKRAKGKIRLFAAISFSNTDVRITEEIRRQLDYIGVAYHVHVSQRNVAKGGKPDLTIGIHRLTHVKKFLETIIPVRTLGKRRECELLLEFVNSRIGPDGKPWPRGGKGAVRAVPYSERDMEILREISTYGCHKLKTPQRAYVQQNEDVLWPASKNAEIDRNAQSTVN